MKTIALVDDHEIVRDGIEALLLGNALYKVIWTAENGQTLWEKIAVREPNVILLDIQMQGESGLELLIPLATRYPLVKVLMLSANTDEQSLQKAIENGAIGFLGKDCSKKELTEAIAAAIDGQPYFSKTLLPSVFKGFVQQKQQQSTAPVLSPREEEIARLLAKGIPYKEIADKLFISVRTVETHRKNILEKLALDGTPALIEYAAKHGWL